MKTKLASLSQAINLIEDDQTLAIGGHTLRRHPMALVAEIIRQNKKNLHLMGWNNGLDMDMIIGAGLASKVETSYIGIPNNGLALNLRRKSENGEVKMLDHSEITALDMFRAGSMGLSFLPCKSPLGNSLSDYNEHITMTECPFTGEKYGAIRGAEPDVAILHAHTADQWGNIQLDERHWRDNSADVYIAWSAKKLIVSVEQIVSDDYVLNNPHLTYIPRDFVTAVVEAPYGTYPCCCDSRYTYDMDFVSEYYQATKSEEDYNKYLDEWVYSLKDHNEFLEKIGLQRLLEIKMGSEVL